MFSYTADRKKSAGRALGTLVEIITYYVLRSWGFTDQIVIERKIPEFGNPGVTHNVEFSIHPISNRREIKYENLQLPITAKKIRHQLPYSDLEYKSIQILESSLRKRNSAVLFENENQIFVANIDPNDDTVGTLFFSELLADPCAIFECKRVGVEEGVRKGPQTIEKAKQGAYVARSISSLQKIRRRDGQFYGVLELSDGQFRTGPYTEILHEAIDSPSNEDFFGFIFTVGVVSNHGNWFTSNNQTKELAVLAQSYDWLLFLSDDGLCEFIENFLLYPSPDSEPVKEAFSSSYNSDSKRKNRFTKVLMDVHADKVLHEYFVSRRSEINKWFNVISPQEGTLSQLKANLSKLTKKSYTAEI